MGRGLCFVISAPSGAGKTTLCDRLLASDPNLRYLVSHTTRAPRPGEVNDREYTFVSVEAFREMIERGAFIEWAEVHGNFYGTSLERLESWLTGGTDVVLDIDVQGARKIRRAGLDMTSIFVLPPSLGELEQRLRGRASDEEDVVRRRLENARDEIRNLDAYDYVVINDVLDEALEELRCIVRAVRCGTGRVDPSWLKETFLLEA